MQAAAMNAVIDSDAHTLQWGLSVVEYTVSQYEAAKQRIP